MSNARSRLGGETAESEEQFKAVGDRGHWGLSLLPGQQRHHL